MFRRFIPASCSACGAGVPRSAAGRCPSCRTAFVAVAQTAASLQGMPLRAPIHRCHSAIVDRGGTAIIPIRRNGRLRKEDCPATAAQTTSCGRASASVGPRGSSGRLLRAKQDRGENARPQILRRANRLSRPQAANSRCPPASRSRTASTHSASPGSNAWHDGGGVRGTHLGRQVLQHV